jgi:hypothetical protein
VHELLKNDPRLSAEPAVTVSLGPDARAPPPPPPPGGRRVGGDGDEDGEAVPGRVEEEEEAAAGTPGDFAARMRRQQQERRAQLERRSQQQQAPPPPLPPIPSHANLPPQQQEGPERPAQGQGQGEHLTEYEALKRELVAGAANAKGGWKWRGRGGADSDDDVDDDQGGGQLPGAARNGDGGRGSSASELEARRARYVSKARQLKGLNKKDRARETALKMRMFEQAMGQSELLTHRLEPAPKLMAEGSDDMYEMTDPLDADKAAESRAMQKIQERQQRQQLSLQATDEDPEWRRN